MKKAIIILLILFLVILMINLFAYEESEVCEEECKYSVMYGTTELCIGEDLKDYIEGIKVGKVNRLKSQRIIK